MEFIDFNKTTFYKGLKASYGKLPVKMEVCLKFDEIGAFTVSLSIGLDKMYRVKDIGRLLEVIETLEPYHFTKNFIFEPSKMYFEKSAQSILEFLSNLDKKSLHTNQLILNKDYNERFLDLIWDLENRSLNTEILFKSNLNLKTSIKRKDGFNVLIMDYSEYGDFEPLCANFKYITLNSGKVIGKVQEFNRELLKNIYSFKNDSNVVYFKISDDEKKFFKKNFLDRYNDKIEISIDEDVKKDMTEDNLLSKVYFDVGAKGIMSKAEFCYGEKVINPLNDVDINRSFREFERESDILDELKHYGFKEYKKLFLLDDVEKIMNLLTDNLKNLKKISQVYYSEDFKKLHVKNIDSLGLSLSDDSLIHMNINLENVSDEELAELLESIKAGKKYYRLKNGSIINLESVESSRFVDLIKGLEIDKSNINDGIFEIPLNRCLYIDNYLKEKGIENVKMESRLKNLINGISNSKDIEVDIDDSLKSILRNYQLAGVKWLKSLSYYSFGGILADDMGLGKTLQVLAFIASEKDRKQPCMVVAPTSIVYNWKAEAKKFTPDLKVLLISGVKAKRDLMILNCNKYDIVITSYGSLKNDVENYKKVQFSYVFIDEAQNIKNPLTLNANSVKSLKARCCFALTGTPIENRLMEVWSIFDFIMPGYLYNKNKFSHAFENPILKDKNEDKMDELARLIKPFIIRRLKKDVLDELPQKINTNYVSEMTVEQKKLYAAYYKQFKKELEEEGVEGNQIGVFKALTRLRQTCAHPATFIEHYKGGSGKLDMAIEILTECISSGHSVLLFSQFTKMLKIIRGELESKNINYYYLDGTMSPEDRAIEIDNFNSDREAVFLISLKAGGTGLNLTKADIVVHFDPWWNPAVEDQASDRVYRIGQKNVVQVYKLLTEGTIEEKIARMQENKRGLMENIIRPGESLLNNFSEDEIRDLFGL
ncbi:DEAD/DEAH box helicase [Herbivorax sp. ANBcel31]|uniref:DEAD/DEAH box helicase n=1 Tax=Herbivorax sp. ANBcel31 TaxID=3069754 RepID=UPI0027B21669|nr:DEAD/DEAH box helicase [Herbivorax sp. ANBcel31]MDQ2085065.1 DEAD/DEAH box helicase [Herbivorax sp. ANBcel31]